MPRCDWNHEAREVRKLPYGGDGNMLLCRTHYVREMSNRAEETWNTLEKYEEDTVTPVTRLQVILLCGQCSAHIGAPPDSPFLLATKATNRDTAVETNYTNVQCPQCC